MAEPRTECPAPWLSRIEVRMDRDRRELLDRLGGLEQSTQLPEAHQRLVAEWSEVSGRLEAMQSVLANHGARLLEGEAHMQAVMEHLGQALEDGGASPAFGLRGGPQEMKQQLQELRQCQNDMAESLRESKGSFNASLGDMKALWRELAKLQKSFEESSGSQVVQSPEELDALKRQVKVIESLLLTYREALSDMTLKLKDAMRSSCQGHGKVDPSLAAHARRQASEKSRWSSQGPKLLDKLMHAQDELLARVQHLESGVGLSEVRRRMEVMQGETLMSFHQLQKAVADLNCKGQEVSHQERRGEAEWLQLQHRVSSLEAAQTTQVTRLDDLKKDLQVRPLQDEPQAAEQLQRLEEAMRALERRVEGSQALVAPSNVEVKREELSEAFSEALRRLQLLEVDLQQVRAFSAPEKLQRLLEERLQKLKKEHEAEVPLEKLPEEKREARLAELEAKVQSLQAPQSPEELWRIRSQSQSLEALSLSMQRLAADLGRQVARLDDLERERGEGQSLEEVIQDKVGRIDRLETARKSFEGELQAISKDARGAEERLSLLERRLQDVEAQRQEDGKASELTELQRVVSEAAERQRIELAEVSRGLQSSMATAQESMSEIKSELQQVKCIPGVYQPSSPSRDRGNGNVEVKGRDEKLEPMTWSPRVADVARLAEELHQARSAAMHQTRMEVHRAEALGALESQVAALNLRVEDVFSRLNEVELGIDTASRGGVALRLRFEQMQSSVELRLSSFAADLSDRRHEVRELPKAWELRTRS